MEALGLVSDVNKKPSENASARGEVLEIFDIPQTDDLTKLATNPRRTPLSGEKQKYIAKLIAKYGNDFDAMGRDTKLNAQQLTAAKLEKMTAKFLALDQKHRTVPIPT